MAQYRAYVLDESGSLDVIEELPAENDNEAVETMRQKRFRKCEIWRDRFMVASLSQESC